MLFKVMLFSMLLEQHLGCEIPLLIGLTSFYQGKTELQALNLFPKIDSHSVHSWRNQSESK